MGEDGGRMRKDFERNWDKKRRRKEMQDKNYRWEKKKKSQREDKEKTMPHNRMKRGDAKSKTYKNDEK